MLADRIVAHKVNIQVSMRQLFLFTNGVNIQILAFCTELHTGKVLFLKLTFI